MKKAPPMNGKVRPPQPPVVYIKVARINPWKHEVTIEDLLVQPQAVQLFLGKAAIAWAKLGVARAMDVMLAGDKLPQVAMLGGNEPEWQIADDYGTFGPILHGIGMVFGFEVAPKQPRSVPVDLDWITSKITWLSPIEAAT